MYVYLADRLRKRSLIYLDAVLSNPVAKIDDIFNYSILFMTMTEKYGRKIQIPKNKKYPRLPQ